MISNSLSNITFSVFLLLQEAVNLDLSVLPFTEVNRMMCCSLIFWSCCQVAKRKVFLVCATINIPTYSCFLSRMQQQKTLSKLYYNGALH